MKRSLLIGILSVGLVGLGCQSRVEEGATTRTADHEIPGFHSANDLSPITAERWIDDVRVGRELGIDGQVPTADVADTFSEEGAIHVSMQVTDAPAGSMVRITVSDQNGNRVWREEKAVIPGRSYLSFSLNGGELGPGAYRAEIVVGDEPVRSRSFVVEENMA